MKISHKFAGPLMLWIGVADKEKPGNSSLSLPSSSHKGL